VADDTTTTAALIAPALVREYILNDDQKKIVSHKRGPLRVIAGPGSGKTRSITLMAMNLLLCGDAKPAEIVLCTYTEKAAFELQDRLADIAHHVDYNRDLSQMQIGTIHSICQRIINRYLHRCPLGNDYETLDHFTQHLLIIENLNKICTTNALRHFRYHWSSSSDWELAKKLKGTFDMIAEELIFDRLKDRFARQPCPQSPQDAFLFHLTWAFWGYQKLLAQQNCIDFAHLQKCAYDLLQQPDIFQKVTSEIRYVLVDEYQDTNYIQERLLTLLASGQEPKNLCVIGDEDQALYRFRGATVRNILEFSETFPGCEEIKLTINYRSHPSIIDVCNDWIRSTDWSHANGTAFRSEKEIRIVPENKFDEYPAVLRISSVSVDEEAKQFAELVHWLKEQGTIRHYNEVTLLLHSVRPWMSGPYIKALAEKGITAYCPRARAFFGELEICLLIGSFARILGYVPGMRGATPEETAYIEYIAYSRKVLAENCRKFFLLERQLQMMETEAQAYTENAAQSDTKRLGDYFYRLPCLEPFASFLANKETRPNLIIFSRLLQTFQRYYRYETITGENLPQLSEAFLPRFLSMKTGRSSLQRIRFKS
jgi:DNA helicase-2/ATP-dependent DNA helicase PcrA